MAYPGPMAWTCTINGQAFNTGESPHFVESLEGWHGTPEVRAADVSWVGRDGGGDGAVWDEPRVIQVRGWSMCQTVAERDATIDMLTGLLTSADRYARFPVTRVEGTRSRTALVVRRSRLSPVVARDGLTVDWEVTLRSSTTRFYSAAPVVSGPIGLDDRGASTEGLVWSGSAASGQAGLQWNGTAAPFGGVEWQRQTGVAASGQLQVVNNGDTSTPVTITVQAVTDVTNPVVQLQSTAEKLVFDGILRAGQVWTVDTGTGRAELNGVYMPSSLLVDDMFQLPPGGSTLYFSSVLVGDQAFLSTTHYDSFISG